MKALIKERPEPGITYRDVPDPELKPGHVIVRVKSCGISGSEIARYRWTDAYHAGGAKDMSRQLPRIMGHEFSGTIAAVGPGVATGDPVVTQSVIGCGGCESCDAGLPNHCLLPRVQNQPGTLPVERVPLDPHPFHLPRGARGNEQRKWSVNHFRKTQ